MGKQVFNNSPAIWGKLFLEINSDYRGESAANWDEFSDIMEQTIMCGERMGKVSWGENGEDFLFMFCSLT